MVSPIQAIACVAVAVLSFAATVKFTEHSASAPQPASLTAPLGSSTGATAAAVLQNSNVKTTVLLWPTTWKAGNAPVGTPCSPVALSAGSTTKMVIHAMGNTNQRRCWYP